MNLMTSRYGIDTSVLVRLITGEPAEAFAYCVEQLTALAEEKVEVFASNQVIGEAFIVARHHYGASGTDARTALMRTLQSGLVSPLNGLPIIAALSAPGDPGLFDRLIADDYHRAGLEVLTLDRKMAELPNARSL